MTLMIVNRRYLIGYKWFRYQRMKSIKDRYQRMKGIKDLGFKICIGKYEFRFYKE